MGKYNNQIKDLETTHETCIGNFRTQHKKRLQKCQELYASKQQKIDKAVSSTDELQAYATIKQVLDTYKETKDKVNSLVDLPVDLKIQLDAPPQITNMARSNTGDDDDDVISS